MPVCMSAVPILRRKPPSGTLMYWRNNTLSWSLLQLSMQLIWANGRITSVGIMGMDMESDSFHFFCTNSLLFLLPWCKRKSKQKEKIKAALFGLLRHFSTLNKKNSLSLKQLFVLDAPKSTSASRPKSEANSPTQHCFARFCCCVKCYLPYRSLRIFILRIILIHNVSQTLLHYGLSMKQRIHNRLHTT